jgi:hypothetical protein
MYYIEITTHKQHILHNVFGSNLPKMAHSGIFFSELVFATLGACSDNIVIVLL